MRWELCSIVPTEYFILEGGENGCRTYSLVVADCMVVRGESKSTTILRSRSLGRNIDVALAFVADDVATMESPSERSTGR